MTDESADETGSEEATRRNFMKTGALTSGVLLTGAGATVVAASGDSDDGGTDTPTDGATDTPAGQDDDQTDDADDQGDDDADDDQDDGFAAVEFTNQTSDGSEVLVDSTTVSQGGYVAIHGPSLLQGAVVESVVGASDYLDPGVHYGTAASLFDVPGAEFEQTELQGTAPLVAMPHRETNGNQEFSFVTSGGENDGPFTEAGLPVVDMAFVSTAAAEEQAQMETATPTAAANGTATENGTEDENGTATPTPTEAAEEPDDGETGDESYASVDFSNQDIEDGTATVGEAVLSQGGFVTLHDVRLLQGEPFESVVGVSEYLEPGKHLSVEVDIDTPGEITEVQLPGAPLVAMPHLDTNGNEEYDFVASEGEEDGAYTQAGGAVVDLALVPLDGADDDAATETAADDEDDTDDDADDDADDDGDDGMDDGTATETGAGADDDTDDDADDDTGTVTDDDTDDTDDSDDTDG